MRFLVPGDFKPSIRNEILAIVSQGDPDSQQRAEEAALVLVDSHLRQRFDTAKIFPVVYEYDPAKAYAIGELVYFEQANAGRVYTCKAASTGNLPTDTAFFDAADPRNKLIVEHLVAITLYILYSSCAPHKITEIRVKRYDDAIGWLKHVAAGRLSPALPTYETSTDSADELRAGSNPKMTHNY